ncbi:YHS domain-containing (seleno)protein [Ostreiculturibacter nitratireducens]|uniref:YHS domain-containing (seleno)protein n=1 Tax=Ostreiculturibacter nitratireducens TaxID=3075226 RepID=UPI0031B5EFBB
MTLKRRAFLITAAALILFGALHRPVHADPREVFAPGGIALDGFDPVAYFQEGRAVEGDESHVLKWRGAMWYFSSAEAMEAFEMNPGAYAPQYGGFCAVSAAEGSVSASDPTVFVIHEGRLYLIASGGGRNAFMQDLASYIARADANWKELAGR